MVLTWDMHKSIIVIFCKQRKIMLDSRQKTSNIDESNIKFSKEPKKSFLGRHDKNYNNELPILHKILPKRDYGRYFCIFDGERRHFPRGLD